MKKLTVPILAVVIGIGAIFAVYQFRASRMTPDRLDGIRQTQRDLERANAQEQQLQQEQQQPEEDTMIPDEPFKVQFECSNGTFVAELYPDWAPLGVARVRELVEQDVLDEARFFRMITQPNPFVVQFGIPGSPEVSMKWVRANIKDDPVKTSNVRGTITFAKAGPDTRSTQLFINLGDNSRLDSDGFAPLGKVIEGMDVVDGIEDKYQESIMGQTQQIIMQGNAFLDANYPGLDYIKKATIVE